MFGFGMTTNDVIKAMRLADQDMCEFNKQAHLSSPMRDRMIQTVRGAKARVALRRFQKKLGASALRPNND